MSNYNFFEEEFPEEVEFILKATGFNNLHGKAYNIIEELFTWLTDVSVSDDKSKSMITLLDWKFKAINYIEVEGSFDYRSERSSSYIHVYNPEGTLVLEFNYDIETPFCCESRLVGMGAYYDEDYENNILNKELDKQEEITEGKSVKVSDIDLYFKGVKLDPFLAEDSSKVGNRCESDVEFRRRIIDHSINMGYGRGNVDALAGVQLDTKAALIGLSRKKNINKQLTGDKEVAKLSERIEVELDTKTNINNTGESKMTTQQRKVVTLELIDDCKGLPVEQSLVATFGNIMTEDDMNTTIQEVIMTKDVAAHIEDHNKERVEVINQEILQRTGQEVKLQPIKLKDLRWNVK